ncbi:MAG: WG repeat-containing protein [Paludibacteraceae bacterium]|nr:WG repeat-containing protein [Paludibacteraceae bacterium]
MKKFIYIVMAAGLMFAGVSANAAPAKKTTATKSTKTVKTTATAKTAAPKARVKATTKYVIPTHTLSANEKYAVESYMKAFNLYNENKPKTALQSLDQCDKQLGYVSARSAYLRAKISYELGDYTMARNASASYLNSKPVKDQGYSEIVTINDAVNAYFSQQTQNQEAAQAAEVAAAAQAAANKKAEQEKMQADIEKARAACEERRKNIGEIINKTKADLEATRATNTRAAYQEFIQNHPYGRARVTAEKEMLEKWPYPTKQLKGNKYGFVDANGKFVIKAKYDNAAAFEEDLARVGVNGLYGYVNEAGKEVIPAKFKSASNFNYGYAAVKEANGTAYYIDKQGNKLGNTNYKTAMPFSEGLAAVSDSKGLFGYIDKTGKTVINNQFTTASSFVGGRAVVGKKVGNATKYAYVQKDGTMLTDFIYDDAQGYQFGLARIKSNGKYGLIDYTGAPITVCQYDFITEFRSDGYARARRNGVDVLIDRNGDNWSNVNGNMIEVKFKN